MPLGVTTSLDFKTTINRSNTANVYGVLKGSDPALSEEYVIYTAHHDHLGVGEPDAEGDKIYNGAMDNASGVAQLLAIGKAFKALPQPPKRSVMLLFVAAEEQGLLGSKFYAEHPTRRARQDRREHQLSMAATSSAAPRTSCSSARASRPSTTTSTPSPSCRVAS